MRMDLYRLIHKAQRQRLFELSILIGRTDFNNQAQSSQVKIALGAMITHLHKHSQTEESFIHPLYGIFKDTVEMIESEHAILESHIEILNKAIANEQLTNNVYEEFNKFLIVYLQHIENEENYQKTILWKYYNDEELMKVMQRYQQSLSDAQIMDNLRFMLPSLSRMEAISMLQNMKKSLPGFLYNRASRLIENEFMKENWDMPISETID
ncbi:hemerythrin domain-containing protein [Legionella cardiaca]|uniref:Hemerythrin domain-containing protein n=1 Tax=Legionella cardiaca TaxID=1071983 RepID=A0ABY8AQC1_9GAMM|nr:hemerythrin domain-containing protein [Legionella cardiaca]WED41971.1 hemerythrin domain-containing protein [Legionella cardiaca]